MSSCFQPEKKPSIRNRVWKGFMSTLQKKLKSLERSKFHFNKTSQYRLQHHHLYDCHFKHLYPDGREEDHNYGFHTRNMVESLLIESNHGDYLSVFSTSNDVKSDPHDEYSCIKVEDQDSVAMETEDDEQEDDHDVDDDDDASFASCESTAQQHGVDAIADDFINKMKGIWKHENQKSGDHQDRTDQKWNIKEHRVDAIAEEFINKMRGSWKLEKQKSVEDYIQRWNRLHEC